MINCRTGDFGVSFSQIGSSRRSDPEQNGGKLICECCVGRNRNCNREKALRNVGCPGYSHAKRVNCLAVQAWGSAEASDSLRTNVYYLVTGEPQQ